MNKVKNYSRFYSLFKDLPYGGDREEFKDSIVLNFTEGRTSSLREMTPEEYAACCNQLENMTGRKTILRQERSQCLNLMQKLGIDTSDWNKVNNFCLHPRIVGKVFYKLTIDELETLSKKLRVLANKGWRAGAKKEAEPLTSTAPKAFLVLPFRSNTSTNN